MFGRSIPLFRLAGFRVGLDWSWLILAVLVTWTLSVGVFPSYYPGLTPGSYWSMGVVAALGLFASIILHELAHSLVARRYHLPIRGITLFIFGGVAEMEREPDRPAVEFLVAIAGPIASFLIAAACWLLALGAGALGLGVPVAGVLAYLASINAVLAIFNLAPAFPLDGGRMLRAALWHWKGNLRQATRIASLIGGGFGVALIVIGVLRVVTGDFVSGMWWFLIGLFVRLAAQASYQQVLIREGLRGVPVRRIMSADPVTVPPRISVQQLIDDYVYRYHHKMFPVVDDGRVVGCVSMHDIKQVPREQWSATTVASIAQGCSATTVVTPDADAMEVLTAMNRSQNSRFLVMEGARLVGVLSIKDMLKFLSLKLDLEEAGKVDLRHASPRRDGVPVGQGDRP
ncbi:MAG TPA: site-2 protease family protein [Geminicoccaceae bacterium]|nr:site-2 protease family protein [Geminicoccaceae bacterium]